MPAETFSKPLENMLTGHCEYEYYSQSTGEFSQNAKTRICHVKLDDCSSYNSDVVLMVFTIRNQNGKWKIHSEGAKRTDSGSTVPLRNAAIGLAQKNRWKYFSIALVGDEVPDTETISQYAVVMESYTYGNETVYDLSNELEVLRNNDMPDFYRCKVSVKGKSYSFVFVKKECFTSYIQLFDDRSFREENEDKDILAHNFYGMHIKKRNSAIQNGEISIGWCDLGDLSEVETKEELAQLMDETYPDKKLRSKAQDVSQVWTFKGGMSIGDYVVFSDGKQVHIGIIKSDYYYEKDEEARDEDYVNNRQVEWLKSVDRESLPKVFRSALAATRSIFSLNAYKSIILELLDKDILDYDEEEIDGVEDYNMVEERPHIDLKFTTDIDLDFDRNRIVFGAPGTGKSYQLEEDRETIIGMGGGYERVTFHPEYTYSSFVGCYKPVSENGKIEYKYVPGPFMRVLVNALRSGLSENPKPYLLVIEEINRAKVAAVFGEVFQLLDRDSKGTSDYEINASEDVKKYLSDELNGSLDSFDKLRIPNNMYIWASMNSADQGVFPMDTAFKRRWSFEYKGIDENEDKVGGNIVLGEGDSAYEVNWNTLRKAINYVLAHTYHINEDKLLGPFFINEDVFAFGEDGMIKNPAKFKKVFKSKVIMYLYEDAAKQQKNKLFSGCDSTKYSSICDAFDKTGIDIFGTEFKKVYDDLR